MKTTLALLFCCFFTLSVAAQNNSQTPPAQAGTGQADAAGSGEGAEAPIDAAKRADIRHLLEVAGTKNIMVKMMDATQANIKPLLTSSLSPGEYRDKLVNLFFEKFHSKMDLDQLLDLVVPAYDKHFSDEEIKELTKFYESPLGRKAVTATPEIMTEAQTAGREWGQNLGRQCMQEVLAENPDLAEQLKAAAKPK